MSWLPKEQSWFVAKPVPANGGWGTPSVPQAPQTPSWANDEAKKLVFAKRLAKGDTPYDAGVYALGNNADAMWAMSNWLRDPFVVEAKEIAAAEINLLDKDQFSAKLLRIIDEKTASGQPLHELKDRAALLKLYAETQGFIGNNVNVDLSKTINNDNRVARITFVNANSEPEKPVKTINQRVHREIAPLKDVNLKLVG